MIFIAQAKVNNIDLAGKYKKADWYKAQFEVNLEIIKLESISLVKLQERAKSFKLLQKREPGEKKDFLITNKT